MTTITDLVPDVISYLVTQCQAAASLGGATPPVVAVFDGPTPAGEQLTLPQRLWIGYDALSAAPEAGIATQEFAYVGNSAGRRREEGSVTCTAEAWDGEGSSVAAVRASCKAIVGAVEVLLRGTPLAGPGDSSMGGLVQWSQTEGPFTWNQQLSGDGASAMCVFRITYVAYLNP